MRVMQVMAGAPVGGAEAAFEETCIALQKSGLTQMAIIRPNNPDRQKKLEAAGVIVKTLPFGGAVDFYTTWKIKSLIRSFKPDIVQTWMSRATIKTPPPTKSDRWLKVSRLGGYYDLKYYKTTQYFLANTPDIKTYIVKQGVSEDRVRNINNLVMMEEKKGQITRVDLQTPDDACVLLALARLHPVKGLDLLIRAAAHIKNIHVWIAGEGPLDAELKALSVELGVQSRVHFLGWRNDRGALMQAANICVVPSRHEPFGNTFVQAWAYKTPLIASRSEGPSQFIRHGEDGLMFDIDDQAGLEKSIRFMMENPAEAKKMAENGYQRYVAEFSVEKTVAAYHAYYEDILSRENLKS